MRLAYYLAALVVSAGVANSQQYAACTDNSVVTAGLVPALLTTLLTTLLVNSAQGCGTYCKSQTPAYSYSYYENGFLLSACFCSNTPPPAGKSSLGQTYYDTTTDNSGTCSGAYTALVLNQPFTFAKCFTSTSLTITNPGFTGTVATIDACFSACATYTTMKTVPLATSNQWQCTCGTGYSGGTAANCGEGVAQLYTQVLPSGGMRRRRNLRLLDDPNHIKTRQEIDAEFCPYGMSACSLDGDTGAFECIDTQSELESCGGCMTAPHNSTSTEAIQLGTDCTSIPGISLGGVTCRSGTCVISACKPGYVLSNKACIVKKLPLVNQDQRRGASSPPISTPAKRSPSSARYPPPSRKLFLGW